MCLKGIVILQETKIKQQVIIFYYIKIKWKHKIKNQDWTKSLNTVSSLPTMSCALRLSTSWYLSCSCCFVWSASNLASAWTWSNESCSVRCCSKSCSHSSLQWGKNSYQQKKKLKIKTTKRVVILIPAYWTLSRWSCVLIRLLESWLISFCCSLWTECSSSFTVASSLSDDCSTRRRSRISLLSTEWGRIK